MQQTRCPSCDMKIKFHDEHLGKRLKCPGCGDRVDTSTIKAQPVAASVGAAAVQAQQVRRRREAANAKDTRLPLPVHTALVGAISGVFWGIGVGILMAGCTFIFGYNLFESGEYGAGSAILVILIALVVAVGFYAVCGALIGLVYGLSGSFLAAVAVGVALPLVTLVGGFNLFGLLMSLAFAFFTCKAIETESFS